MTSKDYSPKITLISSGLGHIARGIETWTQDLAVALKERGINVTVYAGAPVEGHPDFIQVPCLKRTHPFSQWLMRAKLPWLWKVGWGGGYLTEQYTFTRNLLPELKKQQYDIIHTQDPHIALLCKQYHQKGLIQSKTILAHGTEEPFEFLDKLSYLQHLAPYHQQEADDAGVNNTQSFVIGNFIETDKFTPDLKTPLRQELGIPENAFVVGCIAAIKRHHKRIDYLIEEMGQIQNENIYLLVAGGREDDTDELIQMAKDKMGDRVQFLINFPRARIQEVFAAADIYVLCSLKEMMPIALLEAIASGLPAIVHQYPVEEWMIGPGGESIDMSAPHCLKNTVEKYYNDTELCAEKSQAARQYAEQHFAKNVIVDKILMMYQEIGDSALLSQPINNK